jgi:hypothetical protein
VARALQHAYDPTRTFPQCAPTLDGARDAGGHSSSTVELSTVQGTYGECRFTWNPLLGPLPISPLSAHSRAMSRMSTEVFVVWELSILEVHRQTPGVGAGRLPPSWN